MNVNGFLSEFGELSTFFAILSARHWTCGILALLLICVLFLSMESNWLRIENRMRLHLEYKLEKRSLGTISTCEGVSFSVAIVKCVASPPM